MLANLENQQWPQDWKMSIFIPVPKKGNAKACSNYHTTSLISHASKVMLRNLQARFQQYENWELPGVQAEFWRGRGIRDQIANIYWIMEKASESERHSVVSSCLWPHGLYSPWNSPGQNTGVASLSLLQLIFPTQGSNSGLLHCRQILYQLSHKGSPRTLEWGAYPFSSRSSQPRRTRVSCIAGIFFTNWATSSRKTSTSVLLTKVFDCVDHNKLEKFLKKWKYQSTLPVSWEICMWVRKQQLELDMEQWTGSKLGKKYLRLYIVSLFI